MPDTEQLSRVDLAERIRALFFPNAENPDGVTKYILNRLKSPEGRERLLEDMREEIAIRRKRGERGDRYRALSIPDREKEKDRIEEEYLATVKRIGVTHYDRD